MILTKQKVIIEQMTPVYDAYRLIEKIGRVCYKSEERITPTSSTKFIENIVARNHLSVIEHCIVSIRFIVNRGVSHELVRHRLASYCIDGEAITETTIPTSREVKKRTIKQLYDMKKTSHGKGRLKLIKLNAMDEETGKIVQGRIDDVIYSGKKQAVELIVEGGYAVKCTLEHRFYTEDGWFQLSDIIKKGLKIATNGIPEPDRDWLIAEYIDKRRTRPDIAKELGVSDSWLGKYIKRAGIKKPLSLRINRAGGRGIKGMHGIDGIKKISERMHGEKNPMWRGGTTTFRQKLCKEITAELRRSIYQRDSFSCRLCNETGGKLTLHHIIPIWQDNSLNIEPSNLITLCKQCHHSINGKEHIVANKFLPIKEVLPHPRSFRKLAAFRKVISCNPCGEIDTYDIAMKEPYHNFIANGFVVHNSQESTRYCNYSNKNHVEFIIPHWLNLPEGIYHSPIVDSDESVIAFTQGLIHSELIYKRLIGFGKKPEDARDILPIDLKTELVMTANLREWLIVCQLRTATNAHPNMRQVMNIVYNKLQQEYPEIFKKEKKND
ncbi:MAG: hypothetical protein EOM85_03910 [Candidatus Moranbacteria bacterium]|nr:hypothetical protein [Candidatus Moranbacteria bacterium]